MTPDRWAQARQIFDGALDRSLNARSAYVSEACQGDKDLQHEVESLLAQHAANDPLLDGRFWESLAPSPASSTGRPDNQLGPYRLIERLGEGGMGEVWLAQQDQPIRRKVALTGCGKSSLVKQALSEVVLRR